MDLLMLIPFTFLSLYMLLFVAATLHELAVRIVQREIRVNFRWRSGSRFLASVVDRRFRCDPKRDLAVLGLHLSVVKYEHPKSAQDPAACVEAAECVFCLSAIEEGEEVRELKCRHLFHRSCLDQWLMHARATCPLCRDSLVPHQTWTRKMWDVDHDDGGDVDDSSAEEFVVIL